MRLHNFTKPALAAVLAGVLALTGCQNSDENQESTSDQAASAADQGNTPSDADTSEGNTMTSLEVIREMGNGINLGNTLEAYNHQAYLSGSSPTLAETSWGQPTTTQEMIQGMKNAGFDTIRIPIAWTNGMNFESGDYTIDSRLMDRVDEVVNWALDADMYVIINDHWDGGWWGMFGSADQAVRDQAMEMYKSMWTQIGEHFADSSYKLIFEGANEELGDRLNDKNITGSKGVLNENECYETTNMINSEFVKTIRSLGGKNADRFLLIAGYNTDITKTCDDRFVMPEDTADSKLLLSVHYYTPWDYCGTDGVNQWGSPSDYDEMNGLFEKLSKFSEQGCGVVIGEYAVMKKNGGIKEDTDLFYSNLMDNCDLYDFCPVLWDCSNFYKRITNTLADETLAELFSSRAYSNQKGISIEEIKSAAKQRIEDTRKAAEENAMADVELAPSDDAAIAWIMYQSADYTKSYSVGDNYDPTNKTKGIKEKNALITGEGTYTVSLDFSECGSAKGVAFAALGISNGEDLFPGYTISIDKILINNSPYQLDGKEYTSSDDEHCTRVNLYNAWVSSVPDDARTPDGDLTDCSAQIMALGDKTFVESITITFTVHAPN
ncbi:MAG: glycoside hydrolase family 5 protein [Oscillospiraceae bacterium]|nr:glycoside hydrolase family 5 protein [Oscillospiraceae bacterium]